MNILFNRFYVAFAFLLILTTGLIFVCLDDSSLLNKSSPENDIKLNAALKYSTIKKSSLTLDKQEKIVSSRSLASPIKLTDEAIVQEIDDFIFKKSNRLFSLKSLEIIAHCEPCKQRLHDAFLYDDLSTKRLSYLANWLTKGNQLELAKLLTESTEQLTQENNNKRLILTNALTRFNSPIIANYFADYLIDNQNVLPELQNALIESINSSSDRLEIAKNLVSKFNEIPYPEVRNKLLSINQPEFLGQINLQALEQADKDLYEQTMEQIKSNSSKNTIDVILSMANERNTNLEMFNQVEEAAKQWAYRQLSGNRLDYIENELAQGAYSQQEKTLLWEILKNCEDSKRGLEIVNKYSNL